METWRLIAVLWRCRVLLACSTLCCIECVIVQECHIHTNNWAIQYVLVTFCLLRTVLFMSTKCRMKNNEATVPSVTSKHWCCNRDGIWCEHVKTIPFYEAMLKIFIFLMFFFCLFYIYTTLFQDNYLHSSVTKHLLLGGIYFIKLASDTEYTIDS